MKDIQHHEAPTERVALVSGATGGMGGAICVALLADGLQVVMLGRDEAKLERARLALIQQGRQSLADRWPFRSSTSATRSPSPGRWL